MCPKEIMSAFVEAHNAHDVERMMTYLAEDSVMIDVAAPIPLNSKGDVRKLYEMIFASFDVRFEIAGMIAEGDRVFAALRTTGLGKGQWQGRDITGLHCDIFEGMFCEMQGNQIKKTMFYSDTATLARQLGGHQTAIQMSSGVKSIM
jgi:predicted ester cyclase